MSGNEITVQRISTGNTDIVKLSLMKVAPIGILNRNESTLPPPPPSAGIIAQMVMSDGTLPIW